MSLWNVRVSRFICCAHVYAQSAIAQVSKRMAHKRSSANLVIEVEEDNVGLHRLRVHAGARRIRTLCIPSTNAFLYSYVPHTIKSWNSLSPTLVNAVSLSSFKHLL